jgi:hypothetical protein
MKDWIALSGWARSGKDSIAEYLVKEHGYTRVSFADPMREALVALNPQIRYFETNLPLATAVRIIGWEELKENSEDVRELLQRMGTEVGRNLFGENFWVDLAIKEARKHKKVVFSDCRYLNEAEAIRKRGGKVWRITRPGVRPANTHTSEKDLDDYRFDARVTHDSTLPKLHKKVDQILEWAWLDRV